MAKSILSSCGIYSIRNKFNGKQYIGSSVNIRKRWNAHRKCLLGGTHHSTKLQRAWTKYGSDAFEWLVLEYIEGPVDKQHVLSREQCWIDSQNSAAAGYNALLKAGSPMGSKRTAETRARMSEAAKKRGVLESTKAAFLFAARNPTEETRRKMSASQKAKGISHEQRERMLAALRNTPRQPYSHSQETKDKLARISTGKRHTPESRAKISQSLSGKAKSAETRAKMSKPKSAEARANMSKAHLGKRHTDEAKAKMSANKKRKRAQDNSEGQLWLTLPTGQSWLEK